MQTQEDHSNPIPALNVDSLKVNLVVIHNTCSETEESNLVTASNKSVKECSLNSGTKDVHAINYKMSKAKERCMAYFRSLHSHLQVLSKDDFKGTRIEHGFKRAFMSLFGQDVDTFTRTMLLNVYQLQKQLDKDEFQEDGSMTAFWVTHESKIDTGKALDNGLVVMESNGTESEVQDDSSKSRNDTDADDADIRPIYDEEQWQHGQILNETNSKAKIEKKIDVLETMNIELEHSVAKLRKENQTLKQNYKDLYDSIKITRSKTTEQTPSLLANNAELKARIQEKVFAIAALKNDLRKLKGNSVDTKFDKTSVLGKPVLPSIRNQSVVRKPNAFKFDRDQMSKQWFASQIFTGHRFSPNKTSAVYEKTSLRSNIRWKPTGRIFKSVGLRWIPTGMLFDSCTSKIDSEPPHGLNVDILNIHECKQTLDVSAGKSQSMVAEKADISETIVKVDSQMMIQKNDV
ncbi:hypothetical protein Tco_1428513 [Tanacetum coccineum]